MNQVKFKKNIDLDSSKYHISNYIKCLIALIYILPIFSFSEGALSELVSVLVTFAILLLFFTDKFYLTLPILIFFYSHLVIPGGLSVFRFYSILFVFKLILTKRFKIELSTIPIFLVISIYSLLTIAYVDIRVAFFIVFDIIFLMLYISNYLKDKTNFKLFFKFYSYAAVSAAFFGVLRANLQLETAVNINGSWVNVTRFLATYNDPNYLGFFFNIAIFSIIALKLFKSRWTKWCVLLICYLSLIATLSTTAILCNILGLLIYLILTKKINFKQTLLTLIIIQIVISLYNLGINKDIPVISDAALKTQSKIIELQKNDIEAVTANRSDLWLNNLEIYKSQSFEALLFGGNKINAYIYDKQIFKGVSHQELIDLLLNIGLLGAVILITFYFIKTGKHLLNYSRYKEERDLTIVLIKYIWLFYAFGLTMFPGWMFYLFFLL